MQMDFLPARRPRSRSRSRGRRPSPVSYSPPPSTPPTRIDFHPPADSRQYEAERKARYTGLRAEEESKLANARHKIKEAIRGSGPSSSSPQLSNETSSGAGTSSKDDRQPRSILAGKTPRSKKSMEELIWDPRSGQYKKRKVSLGRIKFALSVREAEFDGNGIYPERRRSLSESRSGNSGCR